METLSATGTDGLVDQIDVKKIRTKHENEIGLYWEKLQATIGGFTTRKTLAIRNRLNDI
jgi:hypothetical protein